MAMRGRCTPVVMICPRWNRAVHGPAMVGGITEVEGSSGTFTQGRKVGEVTPHQQHGRNRGRAWPRRLTRVEEGGSGGARPNGIEGVPFIGASNGSDGMVQGGG
jgi:hypothetical protein